MSAEPAYPQQRSSNEYGGADFATWEKELYFLIAKFLSAGPCAEASKALTREINRYGLVPYRQDFMGSKHPRKLDEFARVHEWVPSNYLPNLCQRLTSLLNEAIPPSVPGLKPSLLGRGKQSLLRIKGKSTVRWPVQEYLVALRHGALLQRPSTSPASNIHICHVLRGRESAGRTRPSYLCSKSFFADHLKSQTRILGHLSSVFCVIFDRTGRVAFTGADDKLVKAWDVERGRLIYTYRGCGGDITDLSVNHENTLLAAGGCDRLIRVWSLQSGATMAVLQAHSAMVNYCQFLPFVHGNLRYLVSSSNDGSICFWTWEVKSLLFELKPVQYSERSRPGAQMSCCQYSPGGQFVVAGSTDCTVRVYKVRAIPEGPERILEEEAHQDRVQCVVWSFWGLRFISGSRDGTLRIWKYSRGQWKNISVTMRPLDARTGDSKDDRLHRHMDASVVATTSSPSKMARLHVAVAQWSQDDAYVIASVTDYTLRLFSSDKGHLLRVLKGHTDYVYSLDTTPLAPHLLLVGGHDGYIALWDMETGKIIMKHFNQIEGHGHGAYFDCLFSPDFTKVAATDSHGNLTVLSMCMNSGWLQAPKEQFFHTDYRPTILHPEVGQLVDEQTHMAPHLLPPPFLVDSDGSPYPADIQRLVPGREDCPDSFLIPQVVIRTGEMRTVEVLDIMPPNNDNHLNRSSGQDTTSSSTDGLRGGPSGLPMCAWTARCIVPKLEASVIRTEFENRKAMGKIELETYEHEKLKPPQERALLDEEDDDDDRIGYRQLREKPKHRYGTRRNAKRAPARMRRQQLQAIISDELSTQSSSTADTVDTAMPSVDGVPPIADEAPVLAPAPVVESTSVALSESSNEEHSDWAEEAGINDTEAAAKYSPRKRKRYLRRPDKLNGQLTTTASATTSGTASATTVATDIPTTARLPRRTTAALDYSSSEQESVNGSENGEPSSDDDSLAATTSKSSGRLTIDSQELSDRITDEEEEVVEKDNDDDDDDDDEGDDGGDDGDEDEDNNDDPVYRSKRVSVRKTPRQRRRRDSPVRRSKRRRLPTSPKGSSNVTEPGGVNAQSTPLAKKRSHVPGSKISRERTSNKSPAALNNPDQGLSEKPVFTFDTIDIRFHFPAWITETMPRRSPYFPQVGDEVVYFWQGHELYIKAVDDYKPYVIEVPKHGFPWHTFDLKTEECCKVLNIRWLINPFRLCSLTLALMNVVTNRVIDGTTFIVQFHDMPNVIDFIVLRQHYDKGINRRWKNGNAICAMIDDRWYFGHIERRIPLDAEYPRSSFQCLEVIWENGDKERMSPWDLEPVEGKKKPQKKGLGVPLSREELITYSAYQPKHNEWPQHGQMPEVQRLLTGFRSILTYSIAENFAAPVDVHLYPDYMTLIEYPMCLNTIIQRLEHNFYRRVSAVTDDVEYIAKNASRYNLPGTLIVRCAKQLVSILLRFIEKQDSFDISVEYSQTMSAKKSYLGRRRSSSYVDPPSPDDSTEATLRNRALPGTTVEDFAYNTRRKERNWKTSCKDILDEIIDSSDSAPFRNCSHPDTRPDYYKYLDDPVDLNIVAQRLARDVYEKPADFAYDIRAIFEHAKSFNPPRGRIYGMVHRLLTQFDEKVEPLLRAWRRENVTRRNAASARQMGESVLKDMRQNRPIPEAHPNTTMSQIPNANIPGSSGQSGAQRRRRVIPAFTSTAAWTKGMPVLSINSSPHPVTSPFRSNTSLFSDEGHSSQQTVRTAGNSNTSCGKSPLSKSFRPDVDFNSANRRLVFDPNVPSCSHSTPRKQSTDKRSHSPVQLQGHLSRRKGPADHHSTEIPMDVAHPKGSVVDSLTERAARNRHQTSADEESSELDENDTADVGLSTSPHSSNSESYSDEEDGENHAEMIRSPVGRRIPRLVHDRHRSSSGKRKTRYGGKRVITYDEISSDCDDETPDGEPRRTFISTSSRGRRRKLRKLL